ncbi:MAG TPA: DUF6049 family protein, partial [Pseudonocardia sp.]|nr:DUF6049 family protein [Pseudonocardia sp.]
WAVDGDGATALFESVERMMSERLLTPRDLRAVAADGAPLTGEPRRVAYPIRDGEAPVTVVDDIRRVAADVAGLSSAATDGGGVGASPEAVFAPLRQGVLRPASSAWRERPELAERHARLTSGRIDELRAAVRVLEPPSPFSLGTSTAPLLLTVANGLPVTMRVRLELTSTTGLRVAPIPEVVIPPLGRRQVEVTTEVTRSGRFSVEARVRTPDGGALGPPSRLQVRSTAYGTITVWLTGSAGVLLVVLVARRVLRRIRGEAGGRRGPAPGPPTPGPPEPDGGSPPPERPRTSDGPPVPTVRVPTRRR